MPKPEIDRKTVFLGVFGSMVVTFIVMLIRYFGVLQSFEFQAYDFLMRARLPEKPDPYVSIVGITSGEKISDKDLQELIEKINTYKPSVIGLDIYRDQASGLQTDYKDLLEYLEDQKNVILTCLAKPTGPEDTPGRRPPLPANELKSRLGFSDILPDTRKVIRRHLLFLPIQEKSPCKTKSSLSFQLAFNYLKSLKPPIKPETIDNNNFKINNTTFKNLGNRSGGYQKPKKDYTSVGFQILLNYRSHEPGQDPFDTLLRSDVLYGLSKEESKKIENRIVLIGYTSLDQNVNKDIHLTPYSYPDNNEMSGVIIQAHMVSQILNAVDEKENRPLLSVSSVWIEAISIWFGSLIGGVIVWFSRSFLKLLLIVVVAVIALSVLCFVFLWKFAVWLPLIPPALALILVVFFVQGFKFNQRGE